MQQKEELSDCYYFFNLNDERCRKLCENINIIAFKF